MRYVDDTLLTLFALLLLSGNAIMSVVGADVLVGRIQDPCKEEPDMVVISYPTLAPSGSKFWTEFQKKPKQELCTATHTHAGIKLLGMPEQDCSAIGILHTTATV
jgi:hypothetical protein